MEIEYDPKKSLSNLSKHGISFEDAKNLWSSQRLIVEANSSKEKRFIAIGKINDKFYSCIHVVRKNSIRIISLRRSRKKEENLYHEKDKRPKSN
ncbi:MAG: uncharacterized DUF497 family protein [Candidatus Omnitrophota bacterium]|jgi:uncharacterized DUF497 family protein